MNIIELVKTTLQSFPRISEICSDIHVDFTDESPTSYGLYPTGDVLIKRDILGNETRKHTFTLQAIYQSQSDYDRLSNSGVLLELQLWLEKQPANQQITVTIGDITKTGRLKKLTCSNGMLFRIPNGNMNDGVCYQLQISAEYKLEREV